MVTAMFLAHLVGDYVLQTNRLAAWKRDAFGGVLLHSTVVLAVTWLFMLPFEPTWWAGLLIIGLGHAAVDVGHYLFFRRFPALRRRLHPFTIYAVDQSSHILLILAALSLGGYLPRPSFAALSAAIVADERWRIYVLGYVFLSMPAWVLLKYMVSGLTGQEANFSDTSDKYLGILERLLITTFVALGQFILVPLVAAPRLLIEGPRVRGTQRYSSYLTELLTSIALATAVGLILSHL